MQSTAQPIRQSQQPSTPTATLMSTPTQLSLHQDGKAIILSTSPSTLRLEGLTSTQFPWWRVLWVGHEHGHIEISALSQSLNKRPSQLESFRFSTAALDQTLVNEWTQSAIQYAYPNSSPSRRLRIFVNPFSGSGNGRSNNTFDRIIKPIFAAAHCTSDVHITKRAGHAYDSVKAMGLDVDVLVAVSGDGLVHECINGLADHANAAEALRIPIAPIPTGSANALCVNLLGPGLYNDVAQACINVIKGQQMAIDLCSVESGPKKTWSFLSQTIGLMAECDLETEHLRWMGEGRFMYGYLKGLVYNRKCPITLEFKRPIQDKGKLVEEWNKSQGVIATPESAPPSKQSDSLVIESEDWVTFEEPFLHCVAGKLPYISRDVMAFPLARPTDGLIDVAIQTMTSRVSLLQSIDSSKTGQVFFSDTIRYMKVKEFRIIPQQSKGSLSIDGERHVFEPCTIRVHPAMANILSPNGQYIQNFAGHKLS